MCVWCNILTGSKCIIAVVRKPVFRFTNSNIEEVFARVLSPTWRMDSALHFLLSFHQKEHCKQDPKVIRSFLRVSILAASPHEHTVLFVLFFCFVFFCRPCPSLGYNLAPLIVCPFWRPVGETKESSWQQTLGCRAFPRPPHNKWPPFITLLDTQGSFTLIGRGRSHESVMVLRPCAMRLR